MDRALIEADGGPAPSSTVPADDGLAASRRSRRWRRLSITVLSAFVLAALTQQLGMRTDTVSGTSGDLTVTITYADRGRGALAAAFKIDVVRPAGFDGEIEVRTRQSYLEIFDDNGFEPDADSTTTDGGYVVWAFDPPPGSELNIILDARIEPGVFGRERGTTTVSVGDDVVTLDYTTWVAP
ncbi:MAG: hypothetical protein ABIP36_04810 [Acidimicrobiales bacterium]